jgi:3' terminal RNA ribose 2'-O-methyltransferase Hen1
MQMEISLKASPEDNYSARDLGFLLHKHPDFVHRREVAQGVAHVFYPHVGDDEATAVLHLEVDPIGLVRGKGDAAGLLEQYVNDRPYAVNSLLAVTLGRVLGQSLAGKSKDRQELADRALPFRLRLVPIAVAGGAEIVERLFRPLGYDIAIRTLDDAGQREILDVTLTATLRLADLLCHVQVLIPVMDNAKHYFVDMAEVEKLLARGGEWLPRHPERDLIAWRALRRRRELVHEALDRLADALPPEPVAEIDESIVDTETALEHPIRLHDLRLDAVCEILLSEGAKTVLDLGCGEGRLIQRLLRAHGIDLVMGVDPSIRTLETAARRLHLDDAGQALRKRVQLMLGSLTYADRRWQGFDAAALVEVIEHIDPNRLSSLELSLFAEARPRLVVVTTPNRDYNALFPGMGEGKMRHADHRFEWTRAEFAVWADGVAGRRGYVVEISPLGPLDPIHGAPSQMAVFRRESA